MSEEAARAWARIAEAESAAAYAHSAVGPRLSGAERERSLSDLAEHRRQRDRAGVKQFAADGSTAALPSAYRLPAPVRNVDDARDVLRGAESRLTAVYAEVISQLPAQDRDETIGVMLAHGARAVDWGADPGPWGPELD